MSLPQLLTHLSSSTSVTAAVARLSHAVSIPSVSSSTKHGPQIVEMAEYLIKLLKDLKVHVETRQPQYKQTDTDRIHEKLPPVILARTGEDKNKKTVLVYGRRLTYTIDDIAILIRERRLDVLHEGSGTAAQSDVTNNTC